MHVCGITTVQQRACTQCFLCVYAQAYVCICICVSLCMCIVCESDIRKNPDCLKTYLILENNRELSPEYIKKENPSRSVSYGVILSENVNIPSLLQGSNFY